MICFSPVGNSAEDGAAQWTTAQNVSLQLAVAENVVPEVATMQKLVSPSPPPPPVGHGAESNSTQIGHSAEPESLLLATTQITYYIISF
jgi:hypothetical protein